MLFFQLDRKLLLFTKTIRWHIQTSLWWNPKNFPAQIRQNLDPLPLTPPLEPLLLNDIQSQLLPYLHLPCMITQLGNWQIEQLEYRSSSELMTLTKTASQPNKQNASNGTASLSSKFTNVIYTFHQN